MAGSDVVGPLSATGEDETDGGSDNGGFGSGFGGLVDTSAFAAEPLIEEPVASGGDSSLWLDGEEEEDEKCAPEDKLCKDGQ